MAQPVAVRTVLLLAPHVEPPASHQERSFRLCSLYNYIMTHIYSSRLGVVFCFSLTHTVPEKGCSGPRLIFTKSVVPSVRWSGCPAMDPAPPAPSSVARSSPLSSTRIFLFWLQVCTDDSEQDQYRDCEGVCQVMRQS